MKETRNAAMAAVYKDEGGYSNDAGDPGGPTNYGITIHDVRMYVNPNASAQDVKNIPRSVADEIYDKHYMQPLHYDDLPAGVDYAVLDYGINSGISRSAKVLQHLVSVTADGIVGPITLAATAKQDPVHLINAIYDERLSFLRGLNTWSIFGKGWGSRCARGRVLALSLVKTKPIVKPTNWFVNFIEWILKLCGLKVR